VDSNLYIKSFVVPSGISFDILRVTSGDSLVLTALNMIFSARLRLGDGNRKNIYLSTKLLSLANDIKRQREETQFVRRSY